MFTVQQAVEYINQITEDGRVHYKATITAALCIKYNISDKVRNAQWSAKSHGTHPGQIVGYALLILKQEGRIVRSGEGHVVPKACVTTTGTTGTPPAPRTPRPTQKAQAAITPKSVAWANHMATTHNHWDNIFGKK